MRIDNEKELVEFVKATEQAALSTRNQLAQKTGIDMCMYEGAQWLSQMPVPNGYMNIRRLMVDNNPDSTKLRVTVNRMSKFVQKAAAATHPDDIEVEVKPPERDVSPEKVLRAQANEAAVNAMIDYAGYVRARRDANFRRCICGTYGVGLQLTSTPTMIQIDPSQPPQKVLDHSIKAFDFDPLRLILDPACTELDLDRHEFVIFKDVWTREKIMRVMNIDLPDDDCATIGSLTQLECELARISYGRLFARYRAYSAMKGAIVYQILTRDDYGRFDKMFVGLGMPKQPFRALNMDDPTNPFGGSGMPFMLLHGHRRADSMWSISDASMMKDDQDRINLLGSLFFRTLQKNAGFQWLIDRRVMDKGQSDDTFAQQFHNSVAGAIFYKGGRRDENIPEPRLITQPQPSAQVQDLMGVYEAAMRENSHRSEANLGETKSHVPLGSYERALEEADQVMEVRVQEDIERDRKLIGVMQSTMISLVNAGSPTTLGILRKAGLDAIELGAVAGTDPNDIGCHLDVRESSVRRRSQVAKRQDLNMAIQTQAITPKQARWILAQDLDSPISNEDRMYTIQSERAAVACLSGVPWSPVPLGEYQELFIDAFRRALLSDQAKLNPQVRNLLLTAIEQQMQTGMIEAQMAAQMSPENVAAQQQAQQQAQIQQEQAERENQQGGLDNESESGKTDVSGSIGELMAALSRPGSSQPGVAA